jgi:hypothetical protein
VDEQAASNAPSVVDWRVRYKWTLTIAWFRILEINLGAVDITISPHYNADQISKLQFATGAIIFNTTTSIHQAFDGNQLRDLYQHQTYPTGVQVTSAVGNLTVSTP